MPHDRDVSLTDPAFIQRLESLALLARRVLNGRLQATRRSVRHGGGVTFADYAQYSFGDDHRAIDWRVYGRTDHLVIKLLEAEEDMRLVILLDTSRSMERKLGHAKRLAAALAYIALTGLDQVCVYAMGDGIVPLTDNLHGRAKVLSMLRTLDAVEANNEASDFEACCRSVQARHGRRSMVVPISDFFFPGGFDGGLGRLAYLKHDTFCIQVQDPDELTCAVRGDAEFRCVESGALRRVTVTPTLAQRFEREAEAWNTSLRDACLRKGVGLVQTTIDVPFDDVLQRILRRGGLVA